MSSSLSQRFPKLLSSSMWEEINHVYCIPSVLSLLLGMYLHYCYFSSLALCPSGISVRLAPSAGRFCPTENFVVNGQINSKKTKEVLERNKLFLQQLRVVPWDKFRSGFVTVLHKVSSPTLSSHLRMRLLHTDSGFIFFLNSTVYYPKMIRSGRRKK